jgi:hypothetical protein
LILVLLNTDKPTGVIWKMDRRGEKEEFNVFATHQWVVVVIRLQL